MILVYWSNGANIFVSLLAILLFAGAGFGLFILCKREYKRYRDEKASYIEGVLTKNEINSSINTYLSRITKATPFTVMLLDIDHFTNVINAFGEKNVKEIIENVVNNLTKAIPVRVQIGRYAVDQFLFFLHGDYTKEEIVKIATDMREAVRKPFKLNQDVDVNLSASIGIAYFPIHGETLAQLVDSLRIAVYTAKKDGGDRTIIYSSEMSQTESENIQYYNQIKQAIVNKEFCLYYQPIINLENKKVIGAESLIRWNHPEMGVLNPHSFLNVLEQSGDINWVGVWSFEVMVSDYMAIKATHPGEKINFSLNLSPKQLMNPALPNNYLKVLKRHKALASDFIIEVEEFVIFQQQETIRQNINKLREFGFKVAVDGFSLDHSTLMKVKQLPIDLIKISQQDLDDEDTYIKEHFMEILIEFAKQNKIEVIAERIENQEMIDACLAKGIHYGQGYGISKPISIEDYHHFMDGDMQKKNTIKLEQKDEQALNDSVEAALEIINDTTEEELAVEPAEEAPEQPEVAEEAPEEVEPKPKKRSSKVAKEEEK